MNIIINENQQQLLIEKLVDITNTTKTHEILDFIKNNNSLDINNENFSLSFEYKKLKKEFNDFFYNENKYNSYKIIDALNVMKKYFIRFHKLMFINNPNIALRIEKNKKNRNNQYLVSNIDWVNDNGEKIRKPVYIGIYEQIKKKYNNTEIKEMVKFKSQNKLIELYNSEYSTNININEKHLINEMPYPESFNMDTFKAINSFVNRVAYCKLHLKKIAEGSSRIAFIIDDTKVLKLAKNRKGLAQNENEANMGYNEGYFDCIAHVFDFDDNYTFIEMERARKCSPQEFKNIVGYSLEDVIKFIHNDLAGDYRYRDLKKQNIPQEILNDMYENDFIRDLNDFLHTYDMLVADIAKKDSYGIVKRNGHDEVVLLDYGATQQTWDKYYVKRRY